MSTKQPSDKIDAVYHQIKDSANKAMEKGRKKVINAERSIEHFSDELVKEVQEKPLRSLLIAGGIGYVLAMILRKR